MKITIDRKVFAQALSEVLPFAPAKAPIEILKNAKITTKGNRMKLEANDTHTSITKYIDVIECDEESSFLINVADLNAFVSKIKGNTIEIIVSENTLSLKHEKGKAEFQTAPSEEYPPMKEMGDSTKVEIPVYMLLSAVSNGRGFVMSDNLRPQMCAIYAYLEHGDKFGYCATDTYKLIHGWFDLDGIEVPVIHWLIMPTVFRAIINAGKGIDVVEIQISDTKVSYRFGNTIIRTIQATGNFPNFKRVIPQSWKMECVVEKQDLIDSLGRVSLFCDASECVKFDINQMDMTLSVDNLEYMKKSIENLSHGGCNGNIVIGANVNHVTTSASVIPDGEILMRMDDASRPILFATKDNDKLQVIVMPMQLIS
ncbi:DNA polymerase III subunit beta [Clavibacter sp.]|uniref:DNA polymerase III subunit beta n=1 Tax=Clavibacter sp. TaxID=1871044 RepID=UPI0019C2BE4B|nr:DNA polymerase III subunit beta [Clavibacter sp.]MBD5381926.1 DNA polymerase III subunit beta [Clavibacter sp.]